MIFKETLLGNKQKTPACWFMRQAGRYLPEYRLLREQAGGFWELCFSPKAAAEVTLQPIRRFDVDAAIIFSDILVIPKALGQKVTFAPNHGPILESVNWSTFLQNKINKIDLSSLVPSYEAISRVRGDLDPNKSLIVFAGSPWTVATYILDGGKAQRFQNSLDWLSNQKEKFDDLMAVLIQATIEHLRLQIQAGADVVQIFDSWAAVVPVGDRQRILIDPLQKIVQGIRSRYADLPIIYFGRGVAEIYPEISQLMPEVVLGVDQHTCRQNLHKELKKTTVVQGNLSPELLLKGGAEMLAEIAQIRHDFKDRPFVFNLGHGILPTTPVEHVYQMLSAVREKS